MCGTYDEEYDIDFQQRKSAAVLWQENAGQWRLSIIDTRE